MRLDARRHDRGFTLVELMIVVAVIGIIASLAIPNYLRFTARANRSEMVETVGKIKLHFKNIYDNSGTFVTGTTPGLGDPSTPNPPSPIGEPASWNKDAPNWKEFEFAPEGALRMRYWYTITNGGQDVIINACGSFPSLGADVVTCPSMTGNYLYTEVFHGNGASELPTEMPEF